MKLKCVILDDYQNVALSITDGSVIQDRVDVRSVPQYFCDQNQLIDQIKNCEIVIVMRERTPFTSQLLAKLPKLKLLITSGMRNISIDIKAATA